MATIRAGSYVEDHGTQDTSGTFGRSFPFTVGAGADSCLILVISSRPDQMAAAVVKYGGVNMTRLYTQTTGSTVRHHIWYLLNPAVGTANITVDLPAFDWVHFMNQAFVLDGVTSASQLKTPTLESNPFGSSPTSLAVSTVSTDLLLGIYGIFGPGAITIGAGETAVGPSHTEGNNNLTSQIATKATPATSLSFSFTGSPQPSLVGFVISSSGGGGGATVTSVTVSPSSASVAGGTTQQFTASVTGTNSPAQTVTWAASAGTINGSGLFTAPAGTGVAQTVTITATSTVDGTKSGTATVTVPAAYSQYPAPGQVQAGVVYGNAGQFTGTLVAGSGGGIGILIGGLGIDQGGNLLIGVN